MVDKNLFLYDLAVVAILKNEGAYLKEWLDYHLLAGVNHFYLYDNDSPDDQAEVVAPYVEAGLVDYFHAPGRMMQYAVYNDTVKNFKFQCRYMAFIDGDEFIFPKTNQSIVETLDEILSQNLNAAGVAINYQIFGSNNHETADLSRGVLERFTRRAPVDWTELMYGGKYIFGTFYFKSIANPRLISVVDNAHSINFFGDLHCVNSNGVIEQEAGKNRLVAPDKILLNHYPTKSREEFISRRYGKTNACWKENSACDMTVFFVNDRNEEFDDGILKYRAARAENFLLEDSDAKFNRVIKTLTEVISAYASGKSFSLETALTCLALSSYLLEKFPDNAARWKVYEEAAFAAILTSLDNLTLIDGHMFIRALPKLLCLPYPAVKSLREIALQIIERLPELARMNEDWQFYVELNYLQDLFKK
ncbi:MAG: glycosyltransferase family 92 protein [Selenomonadaceae bacterium]|nr:glycosyltransferase family 92 protein [Selenomonadaceae bacterium]